MRTIMTLANRPRTTCQFGFSIVELMVALTISLILLAGIIQVFLANKQTFRLNGGVSQVQENGRFAEEFLGQEVRMAGFLGCANSNSVTFYNDVDTTSSKYNGAKLPFTSFTGTGGLTGYDNVASPLPAELTTLGLVVASDIASANVNDIIAGTDAIEIKSAGVCDGGSVVFTGLGSTYRYADTANVKIEDALSCGLSQDAIVLVTDCSTADMFAITNNPISGGPDKDTLAHGSSNNLQPKLQGSYGPGSEIYNLHGAVLYIGKGASGEPALFRRQLNTDTTGITTQELVEGVENMQVTYGEDTDGDKTPNYFVTAANVTNWENVVAARITLLLRSSDDNITQSNQTYTYNGATVTATDRRLRRVFTTTIAIRNRLS